MPRQAKKQIIAQKSIDAIKPASSRQEYPDKRVRGLYFVVQPSGVMSWAIRYRHKHTGKPRKFTIGAYPAISLEQARSIALDKNNEIEKGIDLVVARNKAREELADTSMLVSEQVETYFKRHVSKKRPHTARQARGIFTNDVLPHWGNKRVDEITKRDFVRILNDKAETAPYMANRIHAYLSHFSNWLVQQDVLDAGFADGTKKPASETSRDRVLNDTEIVTLWNVACSSAYPFGDIVRLLILTGARKSEISHLRWSEVDIEGECLVFPAERMKGRERHIIPLSSQAMGIIQTLPRFGRSGSQPVFTTNGKTSVSGFSKFKTRIDNQMKVALGDAFEPWRLHDLRRTAATNLAALGIRLEVIAKVQAHKSNGASAVQQIYNRHSYEEEAKAALGAWGNKLDAMVNGNEACNIVVLHG